MPSNGLLSVKRKGEYGYRDERAPKQWSGSGSQRSQNAAMDVTVTVDVCHSWPPWKMNVVTDSVSQVTRTIEPHDEIGNHIARGLSERLSKARAKSPQRGREVDGVAARSTHVVKLSAGRELDGRGVLEADEHVHDEETKPAALAREVHFLS